MKLLGLDLLGEDVGSRDRKWRRRGVSAGGVLVAPWPALGTKTTTKTENSRGWAPKGYRKSQSQADYSLTTG